MKQLLSITRGDGFGFVGTYRNSKRKTIDLTGIEIEVTIESADKIFSEVIPSVLLDQSINQGKFSAQAVSTEDWPISTLIIRIKRVVGGFPQTVAGRLIVMER